MQSPSGSAIVSRPSKLVHNHNFVTKNEQHSGPAAVNERLDALEQSISLKPVSRDVYKRLKDIESRIIYLETVSPEYRKFMVNFNLICAVAKCSQLLCPQKKNRHPTRPIR